MGGFHGSTFAHGSFNRGFAGRSFAAGRFDHGFRNNRVFVNNRVSVNNAVAVRNRVFVNNRVAVRNRVFVNNRVALNNRVFVNDRVFLNNRVFVNDHFFVNRPFFGPRVFIRRPIVFASFYPYPVYYYPPHYGSYSWVGYLTPPNSQGSYVTPSVSGYPDDAVPVDPNSGAMPYAAPSDGGPEAIPAPADKARRPPAARPGGGTYPYDSGPQDPVPMPRGTPAPRREPPAPAPAGDAVTWPSAKPAKFAYLAYGERPRQASPVSRTPAAVVAQTVQRGR
jgi:hypothetical protein